MTSRNPAHAGAGIELVRKLASEGDRVFTTAQAREFAASVGLSTTYFRQALHHLTNSGWLVRLRKGLYALSSTVPGVTPAHEFEIAMALVNPAAISHWSALHHHGLTEQAPRRAFVLTTTRASLPQLRGDAERTREGYPAGGALYQFVRVQPTRYFGTEKVWIDDARVTITDPVGLRRVISQGGGTTDFRESVRKVNLVLTEK